LLTELLFILGLVLLNGVFSGAEIAVLSMRRTRLNELAEDGSRAAAAVLSLRADPESFLATVQIGITVVGSTAAAFGGASLADEIAPLLARVPVLAPYADRIALGIVVGMVSFLSLVVGELVPKSLALRAGESYALLVGRPLSSLAWAAQPIVKLLTGSSNLVLRLFGDRTTFTETRLSREEVQQIVEEATTVGSLNAQAGEIAARAIDFGTLDVHSVMVPQPRMVVLSKEATAAEVAAVALRSGHSRLPVYDERPDNVVGFINVRRYLAEQALRPGALLSEFVHPIPLVPDTTSAPALLRRLQEERSHLALVIDEQGTIVGLVTMEDLLEEMVGDILSENDRPSARIVAESERSWIIPAELALHTVNRELGFELPDGSYSTVAGLCLSLAGKIPSVGERFEGPDGLAFEVLEATHRAIKRVRLTRDRPIED
jgi:putative hemolysin